MESPSRHFENANKGEAAVSTEEGASVQDDANVPTVQEEVGLPEPAAQVNECFEAYELSLEASWEEALTSVDDDNDDKSKSTSSNKSPPVQRKSNEYTVGGSTKSSKRPCKIKKPKDGIKFAPSESASQERVPTENNLQVSTPTTSLSKKAIKPS